MSFDVGAPSFSAPRIDRDLAPAPPTPVAPQVAPTRPDVNFDRGVDAAEQARTSARQLDTAGVVTALPGQTTRGSAPVVLPNGPSTVDPTRGARHVFEAHAFRHEPTGRIVEPKLIVERPNAPAGLQSGRLVDLPMTW
jgi:hypothetical protein